MHVILPLPPRATAERMARDADTARRQSLGTLMRGRLVLAALAPPLGVLLRPDADAVAWRVVAGALLPVGVASAVLWALLRTGRALRLQVVAHVAVDVALVTAMAAFTGGQDSQFVLFYVLVVIEGGLLGGLAGGLATAAAACAAFLALPAMAGWVRVSAGGPSPVALPAPAMLLAFLAMLGGLAGVLGGRVRAARHDLERTTRELDRVRVDNDVILRHLATGVLTVDAWGTVAYLNPAAEQVLGLRTLEVRGRALDEAFPERLAALRDVVKETLAQASSRNRLEVIARSARGRELPLGLSTNLLMHEGAVTGVVAVFQDLTEVREMERRARRNQTLAEVGALAAAIAHELRNGLNPISGSVEFLQRELKPAGESAELLELIGKECTRLNKFVSDLLGYARERELALETVDLDEHLRELCEGLAHDPRWSDGRAVRRVPGPAGGTLRGDREQLRQVWLNLANNALEAMGPQGTLTVRWRPDGTTRAIVEFEDQGSGIPADLLPRIGEPFFTTKEGGTGLGVAIAQRIVERHGGTLAFESAPDRGTIARVTLPASLESLCEAA